MSFQDTYSRLDRALHRIAFSGWGAQLTASDLETTLFGREFSHLRPESPVFVTSLPRAGTTLLLDIIARLPEFATHSYRDMPFVLAPVLWDRVSRTFRKNAVEKDRAHADGMKISYDSPEAFEEVAWRAFWPEKYGSDTIRPWTQNDSREPFEQFFLAHQRKLIALRSRPPDRGRYLSKNNANVGRIELLRRMFPDARIVVPFRRPLDQAASMLRQHLRFLEIHRDEAFSRRYMRDIGHFEFGELHRPIGFEGMEDVRRRFSPQQLDYWLGYWVAAFEIVLAGADEVVLIPYDDLCRQPRSTLRALASALGIEGHRLVDVGHDLIRGPRSYEDPGPPEDAKLLTRADRLYDRLMTLCIVQSESP